MYRFFYYLFVFVLVFTGTARAQTKFVWPSSMADITRYGSLDECAAVFLRLSDSTTDRDSIWNDTVPDAPNEEMIEYAPRVRTAVHACVAKWSPESADLRDFIPLLQLYIVSGRNADASRLIERQLAQVPTGTPRGDTARAQTLESIVRTVLEYSRPVDMALLEQYTNAIADLRVYGSGDMFENFSNLMNVAYRQGNFAIAKRAATRAVEAFRAADEGYRHALWRMFFSSVFNSAYLTYQKEWLQALREGTESYLRTLNRFSESIEMQNIPFAVPLGANAPPITGESWFSCPFAADSGHDLRGCVVRALRDTISVSRPVREKVNLIVFVEEHGWGESNFRMYPFLRNLVRRYPELEITLVYGTTGAFGRLGPITPEHEAGIYAKELFQDFRVPATLIVKHSEFWRLPAPDRRRVNHENPNVTEYSFDRTSSPVRMSGGYFLIDQSGVVVASGVLVKESIDAGTILPEMIQILTERQGK